MYNNERGSRFSIIDLIVKIIFFILFVLVLYWLFSSKMPNLTPFYSDVFRDNLEHMQKAGKNYFTDDLLPKEIDEETKITLAEMFEKKLLLSFVDKDGNSCNQYESYVSITKKDGYYELKTNLVCNGESDYVIEIIGCYNYCEDDKCEKTCETEKIVEYQYKKPATKTKTTYSCSKGYTLKGKYCYKNNLIKTISAENKVVTSKTDVKAAKLITTPGTKVKLDYIKTKNADTTDKVYVDAIKEKVYVPGEKYSCSSSERVCTTSYTTETYSCNCSTYEDYNGNSTTTCSTCTRSIPVESCSTVSTGGTCQKPGKYVDKYSCPSDATGSSGSGENLSCWYTTTTSGGYSYKCPNDATTFTGAGSNLQCFKTTSETSKYECEDKTYTLIGKECKKTITGSFIELKCPSRYELDGNVCKKYETEKVKAKAKKTTYKTYSYKWSTKTSLSGWTKTNKTRIKEGKTICK